MLFRFGIGLLCAAAAVAQPYATHGDPVLASLINDALARNPQVREGFARYQAALAREAQVTGLPDPTLMVTQHARTPETRVGPQTTVLAISQRLPWFGKLADRGQLAGKEAAIEAALYEARRAEIVRQLKLAYFDLGYLQRALAITREESSLLSHYETLAQARYAQGAGLQQSVVRLQAELTRLLNRQRELERQRLDAEAIINTLRDRPTADPIAPPATGKPPVLDAVPEDLAAAGREHRPELQAAFLRIESNEKSLHIARRDHLPDVTVGASWGNVLGRRDAAGRMTPPQGNGKDVYSVTVGVDLPIFRAKYDAGIHEAAERFTASRQAYRAAVNDVQLAVRSLHFRLESIRDQIALFQRALLPQAEQALESAETAYSTGLAGILDLLDSERILLDARLGLARLETDYWKALTELERAIGAPVPLQTAQQAPTANQPPTAREGSSPQPSPTNAEAFAP